MTSALNDIILILLVSSDVRGGPSGIVIQPSVGRIISAQGEEAGARCNAWAVDGGGGLWIAGVQEINTFVLQKLLMKFASDYDCGRAEEDR
ncbi:hypothetical protein O3M35_004422 [Rhynocoris fuscipes]|uniref:Uncharacterized protein n=1 Tax=Rhynocoris fuscipes TaxID=488301 RepID=A0AAW1CHD5_9HEMI